jgi:hypothetical protein
MTPITIEPCGYEPDPEYIELWKNPNSIPNKRLRFLKQFPLRQVFKIEGLQLERGEFKLSEFSKAKLENTPEGEDFEENKIIPIVAHIIRRSNGTGGLSNTDLNDAFSTANGFYNSFHFMLEICEIRFINSDDIFNFTHSSNSSGASSNQLNVTSNNVAGIINIYFVPNSNTSWTWRPNSNASRQHILMFNTQTTNGTTLSHELGHWFDLLHTHQGGNELVNGSNCSTAGDFVCDTPADPNLSGRVNASCEYTGTLVDANGDSYNPDTRNLLSYAGSCRNRFSEGQIFRMEAALLGMQEDRGYTFSPCHGILPGFGAHTIQQKSNNRFLDAHESSSNDFSVVTRTAQNNDTQRWVLTRVGGVYTIQQKSNNRYLDAHESSSNDFSVVTRGLQNNDTQKWALMHVNEDLSTYTIQQLSNGRYMDAHVVSANDFSVVTRTIQHNNTQRWILGALGNNTFTIQQKSNGRYVDAHEISGQDFSVVTRTAQNNDTQRWNLKLVGGIYTIQQKSNGRFIDAHESSNNDFSVVTRQTQNNDTQRWVLVSAGTDEYTVQQLSNGRYLDAHESSNNDFSVVTRPAQNNDTQKWMIKSI